VAGQTQASLYSQIDLELSWSEAELPQAERTKHVHALHPYLGKFVPQLVDVFLERYFTPGQVVYDPFVGSGTTLVEANTYGCPAVGSDISAFNCLLSRVKTGHYSLARIELELRGALERARRPTLTSHANAGEWLLTWYAPQALDELLAYRAALDAASPEAAEVGRIVLSRAARSARLTTHFDLDFPAKPVREAYHCHKHKRTCRPVEEAWKFLSRYTQDTIRRLRAFALVRTVEPVHVLHADSRSATLPLRPDGVITSPPYPGLIDYHEQHRYAYELLGLEDRRSEEIGPAVRGTSRAALEAYVAGMSAVFGTISGSLAPGAPVIIVVNDSRGLYPEILRRSGLQLEDTILRHVNRRTGRRAGEFYESILVCRS
jgi:hypothetical protein